MLKALAGLLAPLGGRIERDGATARDVAYLPQLLEVDRSFPINVRDFVAMGAMRRVGLFGRLDATERDYRIKGKPKLFAAGDIRRGQSPVVWAIREGRQAAASIDRFLMGRTDLPR
mgnify:CR=1 FL=1